MCPKEFAMIFKDALDAFEILYNEGCSHKRNRLCQRWHAEEKGGG